MRTHPLTRRTLLSFCVSPVLAAAATAQDDSPAAKLHTARDLLIRGLRYERAATLCREALEVVPDDWQIWATLGCALTARAASIAYAAVANDSLRTARRTYPERLRKYQESVKQAPDANHGAPPLEPPASEIRCKDDAQPYRLTPTLLAERLTALTKDARAAFEQATARTKTLIEKAEATYLQGWGLRLLLRHGKEVGSLKLDFPATPTGDADHRAWAEASATLAAAQPGKEPILQAFEEAAKAAPDNSAYWESLGDTCEEWDQRERAITASEKSLAIKPRNARLWYRLYDWRSREIEQADALALLHNAARYEPGNGWYGYEEAALLVKSSPFAKYAVNNGLAYYKDTTDAIRADAARKRDEQRKAIQAGEGFATLRDALNEIERSNGALVTYPFYKPPVPRLLTVAWDYQFRAATDFTTVFVWGNLPSMVRAVGEYADYMARECQDLGEAERTCDLLIICGNNIRGKPLTMQEFFHDSERVSVHTLGVYVAGRGYDALKKLSDRMPSERAAALEARYRAFQETMAAESEPFKAVRYDITELYPYY